MTNHRPRYETGWSKVVISVFLLIVGGLVNQFLNIPAQQAHQDDRLDALDKHVQYNDQRLDSMEVRMKALEAQHLVMMQQLDALKKAHDLK
jgi:hypothetical protein